MDREQKRDLTWLLVSAVVFLICLFIPVEGPWRAAVFAVPYLLCGWRVLKEAATNIAHGEVFDENFLMAVASLGAMAIGEFPEAVAVMLFYQVGELFQSYAVGKSRASIAELMDIRPDYANVERNGQTVRVDPDAVQVGDIFVVKPGERIPLDGYVVEGKSSVNTSALTGESLPREVHEGVELLSGCVNLTGALRVRATKAFGESTVARILEMVEDAGDRKAEMESFITRFARVYTPAVCGAALLLALVPPLFLGQNWGMWIERALTFLVISCPCALVISVPMSFFGGIGAASKRGILVKGGNYLEALAAVDTLVCDKTGTLTKGSFSVAAVHPNAFTDAQLIEYAALGEGFSGHPIAVSLRAAYGKPIDEKRISDVQEIAGRGVSVKIDGRDVLIGNGKLMEDHGIEWKPCHLIGTEVHVAVDGQYQGHIVIADQIKDGAKAAIDGLKKLGIARIVMLTGDSSEVAEAVAGELGIDEVRAGMLPEGKVTAVEAVMGDRPRPVERKLFAEQKGLVAFVGDGINDAPVLRRADLGVAMGALGSDAAIEAADIVLMDDRLSGIGEAIGIAKRTIGIARQNVIFALGVKALVLLLGAVGLVNMWVAVFADVGVSVIAILNAMRALKVQR